MIGWERTDNFISLLLAYQPVKALGNLNISIQEGLAGAERIFALLDTSEVSIEKNNGSKTKIMGKIKNNRISP